MMNKKILIGLFLILTLIISIGCTINPTPTPTSTPIQTSTPTPTPNKIEKLNTTLHIVPKFGQCYFIPENRDDIGTWYFISPNGEELTIMQMQEKCPPSFGVNADSNGGLWLYNIDSYLDNWSVICKFSDGVVTEKGIIQIDYTLPSEEFMMHPM